MRHRSYSNVGVSSSGGALIDPNGGAMLLPVKLFTPPTQPMEAVTKSYVEQSLLGLSITSLVGILPAERLPPLIGVDASSEGAGVVALSTIADIAGSYGRVSVNAKGRVYAGSALTSADIPNLNWAKLTQKPNTLAGYGISDAFSIQTDALTGALTLPSLVNVSNQLATKEYIDSKITNSSGSVFVASDIVYKGTQTTPSGFLRCNGALVDKTTYSDLYSVLGDRYDYFNTAKVGAGKAWKNQAGINPLQTSAIAGWTPSGHPEIPVALSDAEAFVTKNRIYVAGGSLGTIGTPSVSTVYTASLDLDGKIGPWKNMNTLTIVPMTGNTTKTIPAGITEFTLFARGGSNSLVNTTVKILGNTYTFDASPSQATQEVNYTFTLPGTGPVVVTHNVAPTGSARLTYMDPATNNTNGTSLPLTLSSSQALVTKNRVYMIGGKGATNSTTVCSAPIDVTGMLGPWVSHPPMPEAHSNAQAFITKSTVYVIAGDGTGVGSQIDTVYRAPLIDEETLGDWVKDTSFPFRISGSQAVTVRNKVFMLGGKIDNAISAKVYMAIIKENGQLQGWTVVSELPSAVHKASAYVSENKIFVFGGLLQSGEVNPWSFSADIDSQGNLSEWVSSVMPARASSTLAVSSGYIHLIGGVTTGGTKVKTVLSANILGGMNDYSNYYNGVFNTGNSLFFRLPDMTWQDRPGFYSYIKY